MMPSYEYIEQEDIRSLSNEFLRGMANERVNFASLDCPDGSYRAYVDKQLANMELRLRKLEKGLEDVADSAD